MDFLIIKNLSKKYNDQIVLDKVNLSFPSKGLFFLLGESGGGKSTFINCLCGIEKMDKGEIILGGKRIKNFEKFRNKYIGMVYQNSNMISFLNVEDNVFLKGKKEILNNDLGVNEYKKRKINVLSGGEIQRIAILRSLVSKSRILLCDEPTGSLDKENSKKVMDILYEISKTRLVLIVTHNISLVKAYKGNVLILKNHQIEQEYIKEEGKFFLKEKIRYMSLEKMMKISLKTLFKNSFKMLMSLISLALSFSFLLFSYSASINVEALIDQNKSKYLDYTLLKIAKEKTSEVENSSLTLVKEEMLDRKDILELNYKIDISSYKYDLTPLFSSYPMINHPLGSKYYLSNIEWVPYFKDNEINFINYIEGRFPLNENEVVINNECKKYLSNSRFKIEMERIVDLKLTNNEIISDSYSLDMDFKIVGVVEEFDLLSTPKIYYPYDYFTKISKEIRLDNLSSYYDVDVTLFDRLTTIRGEDDAFSSNKLVINIHNDEVEEVYKSINSLIKEDESYKVYSSNLSKLESFESIFDAIYLVLEIFVSITILISISLLVLVLFSYILDYKKDIGIMLGSGVLKSDISFIFIFQSIILSISSIFLSLVIYSLLVDKINSYFYSLCGINILLDVINTNHIFLLFIISLLISFLVSLLISKRITKLNISTILKED